MAIITRTHYLEVGGVPLATPAWRIRNLSALWAGPELRGDSTLVPHADGRKANPRRVDETRMLFPLFVFGDADADGNRYGKDDWELRLLLNAEFLIDNVISPPAVGATRTAVWHRPDGTTRSAEVQPVGALDLVWHAPHIQLGVLDLLVPAGVFS